MFNNPKRRKNKDNPYTIIYYKETNKYFVKFIDSKNQVQEVNVSEEVFKVFNDSELKDISLMNKDNLHKDYHDFNESDEMINYIYNHSINNEQSIEEIVENKINKEQLIQVISTLPKIQKDRLIKYFFEGKTYEEIAIEEKCSKVAIKYSIDIALKKIYKNFKN